MKKTLAIAAALAAATLTAPAAQAATTVLVTGNGSVGGSDAIWDVEGPGVTLRDATVRNPAPGWAAPLPGTRWISTVTSGNPVAGTYNFIGVFTLAQVGNIQSLIATWQADNIVTEIVLNGVSIFGPTGALNGNEFTPGNSQTQTFALNTSPTSGKLQANNTIIFKVRQRELSGTNNMGLNVSLFASAVPEPGTWMLMILGLGAVGFAMRRRQRTAVRFQFA